MTAMVTTLTEFADTGDTRTFTAPGHSVLQSYTVVQKRKVAGTSQEAATDSIRVVRGAFSASGDALAVKTSFEVVIRRSPIVNATDLAAVKALFREIVASSEFDSVVDGQLWLSND